MTDIDKQTVFTTSYETSEKRAIGSHPDVRKTSDFNILTGATLVP